MKKYGKPKMNRLTMDRHICSLVYQVCTCGHHYIQMDDPPEDRVIMCSDCGKLLALSYQGGLYEIGKRLL